MCKQTLKGSFTSEGSEGKSDVACNQCKVLPVVLRRKIKENVCFLFNCLSKSPSTFNIVSMMSFILMDRRIGLVQILNLFKRLSLIQC